MRVYNYDKDSKEFLFVSVAQKNPKREGEYIFPKNSTTIIPPEPKDNQVAVFNGQYWNVEPDYRGLEQVNKETKEVSVVTNIGRLADGFMLRSDYIKTKEYRNYLKSQELESQKNEILSEIKALDEKRIRAICEPSVKDPSTGETWLEYYNSRISDLRTRLMEVGNDASC